MGVLLIQVKNISFGYTPEKKILDSVCLDIIPGEILLLSGPSGAGKSTLAKIIAGHIQPDEGEILVEGKSRLFRPGRDIQMVYQAGDLFPWLKVYDQIKFAIPSAELNVEDRIRELLSFVQLENHEEKYPNQLSGGMYKRLALARALASQPKLIILDETLSALDQALLSEVMEVLLRLKKISGISIVLISHQLMHPIVNQVRIFNLIAGPHP